MIQQFAIPIVVFGDLWPCLPLLEPTITRKRKPVKPACHACQTKSTNPGCHLVLIPPVPIHRGHKSRQSFIQPANPHLTAASTLKNRRTGYLRSCTKSREEFKVFVKYGNFRNRTKVRNCSFALLVLGPTFNHKSMVAIEMWNRSEISRDHGPLVSCSCTRRSHGILPWLHFRHAVYLTRPGRAECQFRDLFKCCPLSRMGFCATSWPPFFTGLWNPTIHSAVQKFLA
jgi:hypothetical protein